MIAVGFALLAATFLVAFLIEVMGVSIGDMAEAAFGFFFLAGTVLCIAGIATWFWRVMP